MARDNLTNVQVDPVQFETYEQEREVSDGKGGTKKEKVTRFRPTEPHLGSTVDGHEVTQTVQTGFVRGGTSRPPEGQEPGQVQQLDNDGKPVDVHPGEIARIQQEEGSQAAADELNGGGKSSSKKKDG